MTPDGFPEISQCVPFLIIFVIVSTMTILMITNKINWKSKMIIKNLIFMIFFIIFLLINYLLKYSNNLLITVSNSFYRQSTLNRYLIETCSEFFSILLIFNKFYNWFRNCTFEVLNVAVTTLIYDARIFVGNFLRVGWWKCLVPSYSEAFINDEKIYGCVLAGSTIVAARFHKLFPRSSEPGLTIIVLELLIPLRSQIPIATTLPRASFATSWKYTS